MLKILWKREEQFLLLSRLFCYLVLDFYVKTRIRFSLRDKQLFEATEDEITKVDCIFFYKREYFEISVYEISSANCLIRLFIFLQYMTTIQNAQTILLHKIK